MSRQAIPDSVDVSVDTAAELTSSIDDLRVSDGTRAWNKAAGPQHGLWCLDQTSVQPIGPTVLPTGSGIGRWIYFGSGVAPAPIGFDPYEFVFQPGGVASGNVFTSWLALVAAAAVFPGAKLVYFDDTLAPCIIPAGVHNFGTGPAAFTGKPGAGSLTTPLQIVDGAFLLGVIEFSWLLIDSQTTTFCIDAPAGVTTIYIADHVTMITQSGVGGTFIRSTGAGTGAVLSLLQGSNLVSGIALSALAAAAITVAVVDGSAVAANTLSAALGTTALGLIVDATGTISAVQPAVLVPFPILLVAQAAKTFYDDTLVPPLLGVAEVQAAIDALKGTIATGTPYEYVFRPGGVASGNVYTVWATLVASAATFPGAKLVYFDDTFGPCSIPIGVWDFASPTTFVGDVGRSTISPTSLTFDDGAELRNVYEFRSLDILSFTTTQVITAPLGGKSYSFSGTCRVTQTDPVGNFLLSAVGFVFSPTVVTLLEAAEFVTGPGASPLGGQVVMVGGVGSQATVYALDRSNVQRDTIGSLGGSAAGYVVDSATLSTAQVGMNPVPIGVLTVYVLGTPYEYVFQPGGVERGNVYTSWAALVEVAAIFPGAKVVYFDDTFGPCVIPAGPLTWDFVSPTTFRGNPSVATPVTIADGATLSNVFGFDSVAIDSLSTTFVIDQPALPLTAEYTLSGGATIRQMGLAGTFIRGNFVGTTSTILLKDRARLLTGAGVPGATAVLSVTNAGSLFGVLTLGSSAVEANTLATIGPLPNGTLGDPNSSIATAQFGVPGAVLPIVLTSLAANVDYDDALVLPPLGAVEVQAAIDALKGRSLASRSFSGTLLSDAILLPVTSYFGDVPNAGFQSTVGYPADATSQNVTLVVNVTANNVLTTTRFEIYKNNVPTGIFLDYLTTVTGITSITAALVLTAGVDAVDLVVTNTTGGAGNQIAASASIRYDA